MNWPDPGLSRNTRCRCYRCSVPGLAGFTKQALCGARDLIKNFWRRGWDSNPRNGFPFTAFPVLPVQPLLHLSEQRSESDQIYMEFLRFLTSDLRFSDLFVQWRRGWDSNPRWALTHSGFRDRCTNPLCDLSASYSILLLRKNSCMSARHSASSTPALISIR